ncbi:MAG: NYN domain-containing protein [Gammaproteobacteria bacterium]|nr:NYN domain-containing protein [Gammaproteobacteria bacterium]
MASKSPEKISIFVDVQNVYYTCREAYGRNFDYNRFWAKVTAGREVVGAYAYATDRGDEKQQQFQNILRAIGFTVLLKPVVKRADGTAKADWDVGMALDIYEAAPNCDKVVLVSGDGDFEILVERIHERFNVRTEVYSVFPLTASALITAAENYVAIEKNLLL